MTKPNEWEEFECSGPYCNHERSDKHYIVGEDVLSQAIQSAEERGKREAFEEIVTLRSVYVYDDYSTLYQQSEKIWVEYSKVEGEFLKEKLSISTPGQEQLSNSETE